MFRVFKYFAKSLKVIRVGNVQVYFIVTIPALVSFLTYSASNNGATFETELRVVQGH